MAAFIKFLLLNVLLEMSDRKNLSNNSALFSR